MTKNEFLVKLQSALHGLPHKDIEERLTFYAEMIDDRVEEGLAEEEAVAEIGSVEEIVSQIIADTPFSKIAKERIKPKRQLKVWEIVLLALGSPIWLSLAIAAVAVIISLYAVLWSLIISFWAIFASLAAGSLGCVVAGAIFAVCENVLPGVATISIGFVCAGLAIFMFYGCRSAAVGTAKLTTKIAIGIKNCFIGKGEAK